MKSLSFLVLSAVSLVLVLLVVVYYLYSKIVASSSPDMAGTTDGADNLRKHGVTDLASKISYLSSNDSVSWPSQLTQIGSDTTGCQVSTAHCQVLEAQCFDLQSHSENKFMLPIDSVEGTVGKTGYAVKKTGDTIEIVACFAESAAITQRLRF